LIVGGVVLLFTIVERNYYRTVQQPAYPAYVPQRAVPKPQVGPGPSDPMNWPAYRRHRRRPEHST